MKVDCAERGDLAWLSGREDPAVVGSLGRMVDDGQVLVARSGGEVVGWLRFGLFWGHVPFMDMIVVEKDWRGKGVGAALVGDWCARMKAAGHGRVMTSSQADEQGQHFHRKMGFVDCGALFLPSEPAEVLFLKML